jgi:hypothetical protein
VRLVKVHSVWGKLRGAINEMEPEAYEFRESTGAEEIGRGEEYLPFAWPRCWSAPQWRMSPSKLLGDRPWRWRHFSLEPVSMRTSLSISSNIRL